MEILIAAIVAAAVGLTIGFLAAKNKGQKALSAAESERNTFKTQVDMLERQFASERNEAQRQLKLAKDEAEARIQQTKAEAEKRLQQAKDEAQEAHAKALAEKEKACTEAMNAQQQRHEEAMKAQQQRFDETVNKMTAQLKLATDEMLKQRQKEFADQSNLNLGQIVNPLRETIKSMNEAMGKSTVEQTRLAAMLKENIENVMQQSMAAKQSADELARALRHDSKVQGDWGETVLDELLTSQGLERGVHYDTQAVIRDATGNVVKSEEGASLRPDVILHLDSKREVIIDSKVSLTAFIDYVNADNEADRARFLKLHIESMMKHVKELSDKDYSAYIQPPKVHMNYVIMFVPHSGALWTALNAQPDLWRKAMAQNVFIADEQTLFAALRIVKLTWTQIVQTQNHELVYKLANEMLDRVGQFMKKYQALGKALDNARAAYDEGGRKLQPSGQSILQTCSKLEKLGAKQSDRNPLPQLADADNIDEL
jgi:DNA recombination protein RmuC